MSISEDEARERLLVHKETLERTLGPDFEENPRFSNLLQEVQQERRTTANIVLDLYDSAC